MTVACQLSDGSDVEVATFASQADEVKWIRDGGEAGSPGQPDPSYAGCCVQGNLWAASIGPPDFGEDFSQVTSAIGGREVTG